MTPIVFSVAAVFGFVAEKPKASKISPGAKTHNKKKIKYGSKTLMWPNEKS
jgi:hypothetical protein